MNNLRNGTPYSKAKDSHSLRHIVLIIFLIGSNEKNPKSQERSQGCITGSSPVRGTI